MEDTKREKRRVIIIDSVHGVVPMAIINAMRQQSIDILPKSDIVSDVSQTQLSTYDAVRAACLEAEMANCYPTEHIALSRPEYEPPHKSNKPWHHQFVGKKGKPPRY